MIRKKKKDSVYESCSEIQINILRKSVEPSSTDTLIGELNISMDELYEALFELRTKGLIQQNFAGLWQCRV